MVMDTEDTRYPLAAGRPDSGPAARRAPKGAIIAMLRPSEGRSNFRDKCPVGRNLWRQVTGRTSAWPRRTGWRA